MARINRNPYTWQGTNISDAGVLGGIYDGIDNVLGLPAKFMLVKHVNAVAVVVGHCASWVALPTGTGGATVTNDVTGGADGNSLGIAAGSYPLIAVQGNYIFIQVAGYCPTLLGDGSVAVNEGFTYKAVDGTWDSATGAVSVCGTCWLDDTGSPATFPGWLRIA